MGLIVLMRMLEEKMMENQIPDYTATNLSHEVMSAYDAVANIYDDVFRSTQGDKRAKRTNTCSFAEDRSTARHRCFSWDWH